jgi:hypothetical protein
MILSTIPQPTFMHCVIRTLWWANENHDQRRPKGRAINDNGDFPGPVSAVPPRLGSHIKRAGKLIHNSQPGRVRRSGMGQNA